MNQGKLEVVKQEMTRVNVDVLGISKLKWAGRGHRLTGLPAQRKELWHQAFLEGEAVQNMIFFFFLFPFIR